MGNVLKFLLEYSEYIKDIDNSDHNYMYNEILKHSKNGYLVIKEGLIKTHPKEESVRILNRKFPSLSIEVEKDGEVYIENYPNLTIGEIFPLINNLGYFISNLTLDGKRWITEYKDETIPVAFVLEPKYDYQVEIPKILYHITLSLNDSSILKRGLIPRSKSKLSYHPERIYLTDNLEAAKFFIQHLDEYPESVYGVSLFEVDGSGIDKLYSDINLRNGGYYTLNNIKPEYIRFVKKI